LYNEEEKTARQNGIARIWVTTNTVYKRARKMIDIFKTFERK